MKRLSEKIVAFVCIAAITLSMAGCKGTDPTEGGRHSGGDSKPGWRDGPATTTTITGPLPTSVPYTGDFIPTSDELTYPDHVATVEEIHPSHAPGTVKGSEAEALITEVEWDILHRQIGCYANAEIFFENPEELGFVFDDITWGDMGSTDDLEEEKDFYQTQVNKLLTIDYTSLKDTDRLCYDKMLYDCEENVYACSYTAFGYYEMVFNSLVGPQSDILFMFDVFTFDTVEDAENYILLVKDIDRYFDGLCEVEETRVSLGFISSDKSYEEAAKSFDNLVAQKDDCFLYESFEERLDNIKGLSSDDRARLIAENEQAMKEYLFPEFQECADRLRALIGSGGSDAGLCRYRGGDAYYAMLTREMTNSTSTVEESMNVLDQYVKDCYDEYYGIATSGFGWYKEYSDHAYSKGDLNSNLDYLRNKIEADFPDIPPHSYYTLDVPEVFEENFSPAAYLGFHVDNTDSNLLIVNNAQIDDDFGVTVAHEAYPGHMYQSIYTRSKTKHLYMYLQESIGYAEGWASYCEYYAMRYYTDSGEVTDAMKLVKDESLLVLLLSTRVDYGIHVEGWDLSECLTYLNSFGGSVDEEDFEEFYLLVATDPGYYAKYGMGYIWTQKIFDEAHARYPNATEKEIHQAYLDSLTGTFDSIRNHMYEILG